MSINSLEDLLQVAWNSGYKNNNYNWDKLWRLIPAITELIQVVGMKKLKDSVLEMILFHLQGFNNKSEGDYHHTVLMGSPGVGKTMVASILAKIYCQMGLLITDNIVVVKRSDLIGKYVGHSEDLTKKILNKAIGGVLFIDEAYSLGAGSKTDVFSKAIIDTINPFLSERKGDFICIIAGYKDELEKCFFSINPGLKRRFPIVFNIEGYTPIELAEIFKIKIRAEGWSTDVSDSLLKDIFQEHKSLFPHYGGDIEILLTFTKSCHARRVFCQDISERKVLTKIDINRGIEKMLESRNAGSDTSSNSESYKRMFM